MYNEETKSLLSDMMNIAKKNLEKCGYLAPIAFLCRSNQVLAPCMVQFQDHDEKVGIYNAVGAAARKLIADSVITINECTMRMVSLDGNNPNQKMDAIIILHVNLVSKKAMIKGQAFRKSDNNLIDYIEVPGFDHIAESALGDIQESIMDGYDFCSKEMKEGKDPIEFVDGNSLMEDEENC